MPSCLELHQSVDVLARRLTCSHEAAPSLIEYENGVHIYVSRGINDVVPATR